MTNPSKAHRTQGDVQAEPESATCYETLLRECSMVNPNTPGAMFLNLTRNQCVYGIGQSRFLRGLTFPFPVDTLFETLLHYAATEEARQTAAAFLNRDFLLGEIGRGRLQGQTEILTHMLSGMNRWLTVYYKATVQQATGEVECILTCVDENDRKMLQQIVDTVMRKDYDVLFSIDLPSDTATAFGGVSGLSWNQPVVFENASAKIEKYLTQNYAGDDREKFIAENRIEYIVKNMQDKETLTVDYRIKRENGAKALYRATYYWLDKEKQRLCFTRADITDSLLEEEAKNRELAAQLEAAREEGRRQMLVQKQLEEAHFDELRQKDLMLGNLIANIPGGIAIYKAGAQLETLYSSEGIPKLSGRTMEEYLAWIKGDLLENTIFEEDLPRVRHALEKNIPLGKPLNITYRLLHKDGTPVWVALSAVKIREEDGAPIYYAIYSGLPALAQQYAMLCEDAPVSVYVVNQADYRLLFMNREAKKLAGSNVDCTDKLCYEHIMHRASPCEFCPLQALEENVCHKQSIVISHTGCNYTLRSRLAKWNGENACLAYLSDETYRIRVQQQSEALQKAKDANEAKSSFLSRVSHDMRTPLNGILGLTHLMRDRITTPELLQDLDQLDMSGQYLLNLINDTLDVSKIESGKIELHPAVCDGKSVFYNTLSLIRPMLLQKHIRFDIHAENLPFTKLYVDVGRLEQVLMNILGNAVKFTPEGGTIEFFMENISCVDGVLRDRVVVRDNGVGMSADFLPHLFEPFSQEHNTTTSSYQGTGLGMTITKQLVELMGGEIAVKSELGKGTEFSLTVDLPMATEEQIRQHIEIVPKTDLSVLSGRHILLCEDHPLNAQIATKLLEKKQMVVTHAMNGQEGLELFEKSSIGKFDAVLMDIRMPVMDGLEATRRLRALPRPDAKKVPILAMTANAFDADERNSKAAGMSAHLTKPIDAQKLYETLAALITTE